MGSRLELQNLLENLLNSENVYYQPPESTKMSYPAIRYSKYDVKSLYANNKQYIGKKRYRIIVLDQRPDNPVIDKLLQMPLSSFDRHYVADNLNHDEITLYY